MGLPLITESIRQQVIKYEDAIINEAGRKCSLTYPAVKTDCPNCIFDPTTNRSSGRYKVGGPRPFPTGTICPVCRGAGRLESQQSKDIQLFLNWNPRQWIMPVPTVALEVPFSYVQTKGYLSDLSDILRSRRMIVQSPVPPYVSYTFELYGEPIDPGRIVQGRYCLCMWKRLGA